MKRAYPTLRKRLNAVVALASALPANDSIEEISDFVHKLRVATRRADVALHLLGEAAAEPHRAKLHRRLRAIRRAGSKLRAHHVHMKSLIDLRLNGPDSLAASFELAALLCAADAQAHWQQLAARLPTLHKKLCNAERRFLSSWKRQTHRNPSFGQFAVMMDRNLLGTVRELGEAMRLHDTSFDGLHELRLKAKRLRYSLEVFEPCLGEEAVAPAQASLTELQDTLGGLNDGRDLIQQLCRYGEHSMELLNRLSEDSMQRCDPPTENKAITVPDCLFELARWVQQRIDWQREHVLMQLQNVVTPLATILSDLQSSMQSVSIESPERPPSQQDQSVQVVVIASSNEVSEAR